MSRIVEHLQTDWSALTTSDWIGLLMTVTVFILMIVLYIYVFKPGNREKLEKHRYIIMDEDSQHKEERR